MSHLCIKNELQSNSSLKPSIFERSSCCQYELQVTCRTCEQARPLTGRPVSTYGRRPEAESRVRLAGIARQDSQPEIREPEQEIAPVRSGVWHSAADGIIDTLRLAPWSWCLWGECPTILSVPIFKEPASLRGRSGTKAFLPPNHIAGDGKQRDGNADEEPDPTGGQAAEVAEMEGVQEIVGTRGEQAAEICPLNFSLSFSEAVFDP